jgi:hypothetical protein
MFRTAFTAVRLFDSPFVREVSLPFGILTADALPLD